jgi:hypothetical protein
MKITIIKNIKEEVELPNYFRSGNRHFALKENYFIKVSHFNDYERLLGLITSISIHPNEYLNYESIKDFVKVSESEFKLQYLKASSTIDKLL